MQKLEEVVTDSHLKTNKSKTVLIIDDEKSIRDVLESFFEENGYTALTANDGREGIAAFKANQTDLVITDIVMPRVEGIGTIRQIRKMSRTVKIIAMTGYVDSYLTEAVTLGADDSINKPFNTDTLTAVIDRVTQK